MRRTIASLGLTALLALGVSGCGSTEPATPAKPDEAPAAAPEPVTKGKGKAPKVETSNPKIVD